MKTVTKIEKITPAKRIKPKVAAYARISLENEYTNNSLRAQISYYTNFIQKRPEWEFAGVYVDDGISGTSIQGRNGFQEMIKACELGKIDIILTKSIQRFARNTVDLLQTIRTLKDRGIEVWFEKENIHTLSGDGELMLTILASIAQEESRSISENVKWRIKKRFEKGIPNGHYLIYGYRWSNDQLVVEPAEADVVREIFADFLEGTPVQRIAKKLKTADVRSLKGAYIGTTSIWRMLQNITYTGNLLLQKVYMANPGARSALKNNGELPQYWIENAHEAIVPMSVFDAAQKEITRRKALGMYAGWSNRCTCFTSKIKCGHCGKSYMRSTKKRRRSEEKYCAWVCQTKRSKGSKFCASKTLQQKQLENECAKALGLKVFDEAVFAEKVHHVIVYENDVMEFHFKNGEVMATTLGNEGM